MSFIKRSLTNIGILPSYVRYSNKISAEEKVLYSELTSLANNFEDINIKESDYAKDLCLSEVELENQLQNLNKFGFIEIEYDEKENKSITIL